MPTLSLSEMNTSDALVFLRDKIGQTIRLTQQSNNQPAGSTWRINTVNKLGSNVVVSAGPLDGKGRGFFFPYNTFELAPETISIEPVAAPSFTPRNEFAIIGADTASPLYKTFCACAPQSPEAHDLYRTYASEYSEYDTELLDDTLRLFDIMPDQYWTNELISNLTRLLQGAIDVVLGPPPEPFVAPDPQAVFESRHDEVVLESQQEEVEVAEIIEQEIASEPRRRGRPPGSKNKPKTLEEQVQQSETQHAATIVRKQPKPQWEDDVAPGTISNGFATMTIEQFQAKFNPIEVSDVNLQADENFEQVYTDLKDKHFQKELHIFVGQMLEYLNNTATDPQALLAEATKVVANLI
jgi:hypothetical protein